MLSITVREALEYSGDTTTHYLYIYRNQETVLYVGQSKDPIERLMQHLGRGKWSKPRDAIGAELEMHAPASLDWMIDLLTIEDCKEYVRQNAHPLDWRFYQRALKEGEQYQTYYNKGAVHVAEIALMRHYYPTFNFIGMGDAEIPVPAKKTETAKHKRGAKR